LSNTDGYCRSDSESDPPASMEVRISAMTGLKFLLSVCSSSACSTDTSGMPACSMAPNWREKPGKLLATIFPAPGTAFLCLPAGAGLAPEVAFGSVAIIRHP
jgi:hypothetical protein